MARSDHQPTTETVVRPERSTAKMRRVCGDTVALIVATEMATTPLVVQFDDSDKEPVVCEPPVGNPPVARPLQMYEGRPAVCWAVEAAYRAQVGLVYVLTAPEISRDVTHAAYGVYRKKNDPYLQVIECDKKSLIDRTRQAGNVEVFGVPFAVLEIASALVDTEMGGYSHALIMSADAVRVRADHLYELCLEAQAHPDVDAIASWIQWLRRPPYLFSQDFLIKLCEGVPDPPGVWDFSPVEPVHADKPVRVPLYNVRDHVFGEEKLAANAIERKQVAHVREKCGIAALQAVQLAKYAREHPDEELESPNGPQSLIGPAKPAKLNNVEQVLVDIARQTRVALDEQGADDAEELAWANAFGMRNRTDFPLLNDRAHAGKLVYLDSAATSQRVGVALQAQGEFDLHGNANVYRGGYPLSTQATFSFNDARKVIEGFIGAERRSVAFTSNTTGATNLVSLAWGERHIEEGDLILVGLSEHHSNMLPFAMLAERKGADIEYIPYDERGHLDQVAFAKALARKPKLVCVAHVGNMFGIMEPVSEMARMAHEVGARILVDAAQSFPHVKIDVSEMGADWVAFSAHKAYGPMGIGGLWISPAAFDEMDPLGGGGGVVSHVGVDSYYLRPKSIQYEMGTPPVSQAIGWAAALGYLDALGMGNVTRHSAALTRYAVRGLQRIDGVTVIGDHSQADGQTGLVSFTVRSVQPAQLAAFLGSLGVAIRSGGHCALPVHASLGLIGTGRISIGVHTTRDDIDAALAAIELCRRAYEA